MVHICNDKVKDMTMGVKDWGKMEDMIMGEDIELKVKIIGRNQKNSKVNAKVPIYLEIGYYSLLENKLCNI